MDNLCELNNFKIIELVIRSTPNFKAKSVSHTIQKTLFLTPIVGGKGSNQLLNHHRIPYFQTIILKETNFPQEIIITNWYFLFCHTY